MLKASIFLLILVIFAIYAIFAIFALIKIDIKYGDIEFHLNSKTVTSVCGSNG
jgi:hypothetical protein